MMRIAIPETIIARFRVLSLERIGKIEAAWVAAAQGAVEDVVIRDALRDLHTLKGDSRVVGFDDVHVLCIKLEELFALAGQLRYQISEDFDVVVTMATQFMGMLLRKKHAGASGIDLDGFVRQVDEVLRETRALPTTPRIIQGGKSRTSEAAADRLSDVTRERFAIAATMAFLEYLSARSGTSRNRLRTVWHTLRDELARINVTGLAPLLEHHAISGQELARELGKDATVDFELGSLGAGGRVCEALDVAVLHLIRNAIDHGIETPALRAAAGKPARGTVRVRGREAGDAIEISIDDDGAGIDLAAVRAKGVERNLLDRARAAIASERELLDLLFHPGFSTRDAVTEISGRGVGMDAVRSAISRAGGSVSLTTRPGAGSTVTLTVPGPARQLRAYQFLAPGGSVSLAVTARWTPSIDPDPAAALDPISAIQLLGSSRQTSVGLSQPIQDIAMRLRWGFLEISLRAASEPALVTAERICPTPDDYPLEVVLVDGRETLLVRPEHVADLAGSTAAAR